MPEQNHAEAGFTTALRNAAYDVYLEGARARAIVYMWVAIVFFGTVAAVEGYLLYSYSNAQGQPTTVHQISDAHLRELTSHEMEIRNLRCITSRERPDLVWLVRD